MFVDTGVSFLLQTVLDLGAAKKNLVAKVAGAGSLLGQEDIFTIGRRNYLVLSEILRRSGIHIQAEDVGGREPVPVSGHGRRRHDGPVRNPGGHSMSLKHEIASKVTALPALPDVLVKLREYCNDPEVDYAELVEAHRDGRRVDLQHPASGQFGLLRLHGHDQLDPVRHDAARTQAHPPDGPGPLRGAHARDGVDGYMLDAGQLWDHTLAVAMVSEKLAANVQGVEPSDVFTAGMLHDMGKTVLGDVRPGRDPRDPASGP